MHNTYKANGRRGTAISICDNGNVILYNMEEINSLEVFWHIAYALILIKFLHILVLVTMLILFHPIF